MMLWGKRTDCSIAAAWHCHSVPTVKWETRERWNLTSSTAIRRAVKRQSFVYGMPHSILRRFAGWCVRLSMTDVEGSDPAGRERKAH
jgi:hypothetical protein